MVNNVCILVLAMITQINKKISVAVANVKIEIN